MKETSRFYDAPRQLLGQQCRWKDQRHSFPLVWMVVGLIASGQISLTAWGGLCPKSRHLCSKHPTSGHREHIISRREALRFSPVLVQGISKDSPSVHPDCCCAQPSSLRGLAFRYPIVENSVLPIYGAEAQNRIEFSLINSPTVFSATFTLSMFQRLHNFLCNHHSRSAVVFWRDRLVQFHNSALSSRSPDAEHHFDGFSETQSKQGFPAHLALFCPYVGSTPCFFWQIMGWELLFSPTLSLVF